MGKRIETLISWLIEEGLAGETQAEVLEGYCDRLHALGLNIQRVHVSQKALHPVYGGIGFEWNRDRGVSEERYERASMPHAQWVTSPFYHILKTGSTSR